MPDIFYLGEKKYGVPDSLVTDFLSKNPDAVRGIDYTLEGKNYNIPENLQQSFLEKNPSAQEIAEEAPLEQQTSNITYDDEGLNQMNQEINSRVDSYFKLPTRVPDQPTPEIERKSELDIPMIDPSLVPISKQREYTISAAPKIEPKIFDRFSNFVKNFILNPFKPLTTTAKNVESQMQYAISKEYDLPLRYVKENYYELIRDPEITGISADPTALKSIEHVFTGAVTIGFLTHPLATFLGLAAFHAIDEAENAIISKIQDDPYVWRAGRNISELLPEDATRVTKETVEILDLIAKGLMIGGARKRALKDTGIEGEILPKAWKDAGWKAKFLRDPDKFVWEKITKEYITEYSMPPTMHLDPAKVKAILVTGDKTKFSTIEKEILLELGVDTGVYKRALKDGITVEVQSEKIGNLVDKPFWAKAKAIFGKPRFVEEVSREKIGVTRETVRGDEEIGRLA